MKILAFGGVLGRSPLRKLGVATIAAVLLMTLPAVSGPVSATTTETGLRLPFVGSATITNGPNMGDHVNLSAQAIDFAMPAGTPIYPAADGEVIYAMADALNKNPKVGPNYGLGNLVIIYHAARSQYPTGLFTYYAHLQRIDVLAGQGISVTNQIGVVGHTGNSVGAQLHFEARSNADWSGNNLVRSGASVDVSGMRGITWAPGCPR